MAELGHTENTLESWPSLRATAQCRQNGVTGTIVTNTVMGSTCNAASAQEAKRLADYYEGVCERTLTTQHWKPA